MNSKQIGNITEVQVLLDLMKLGYTVFQPYGDCDRYDLVCEISHKFYRIQCKAAHDCGDGTIRINCRSTHKSGGKVIHHRYSKDEIDYFATTFNGQSYLIPVEECGTDKKLRLTQPQKNQTVGIVYAKNYELEAVVKAL